MRVLSAILGVLLLATGAFAGVNMPVDAQGQPANPANEAHMLGMYLQAKRVLIVEHNTCETQACRDAIMLKWKQVANVKIIAHGKARVGDAYWRTAIEAGGKTILDYWVDGKVVYPQIIDPADASSKLSFLYYLGHSLPNVTQLGFEDYHEQVRLTREQIIADGHWVINSIDDLVEE